MLSSTSTIARVVSRRAWNCSSAAFLSSCRRSAVRQFHATTTLAKDNDDLPYHIVVGLPALSPTMESGALAEWYVAEGDAISAGDAVAKIETDKASIDFEAQDDFFIAKLLRAAGDGADLAVGTPIMITVEEESDVGAFKDYVLPASSTAAPTQQAAAASPPPPLLPPAAPKPVVEKAPPAAAAAAPPPPPPPPAAAVPPPVAPAPTTTAGGESITIAWARPAALAAAPLTKSMKKAQDAYVKLYGTTGQKAAAEE